MATNEQYAWNGPIFDGICKKTNEEEADNKADVIKLLEQGKGNLFIMTQTGMSYDAVKLIRRRYEEVHSSGN